MGLDRKLSGESEAAAHVDPCETVARHRMSISHPIGARVLQYITQAEVLGQSVRKVLHLSGYDW
jgi:hypothetical protein